MYWNTVPANGCKPGVYLWEESMLKHFLRLRDCSAHAGPSLLDSEVYARRQRPRSAQSVQACKGAWKTMLTDNRMREVLMLGKIPVLAYR